MHHVQRLKGKKVAIIIDFSFEDMEVIIMHNAGRWGLNGPRAGRGATTAVQAMYPEMRRPCR
jgi:hypothetical protein